MIRVLVVDDTQEKIAEIRRLVELLEIGTRVVVDEAHNRRDCVVRLKDTRYHLLVLDLVLPRHPGKAPERGVGAAVLQMLESGALCTPGYVVGLTAYSDAMSDHLSLFQKFGWKIVEYATDSETWWQPIEDRIRYIDIGLLVEGYGVDVAVVCALPKPELEAVKRLPYNWIKFENPRDPGSCYYGSCIVDGKQRVIVATACAQMGMPAAAATTMKVIETFRPRRLMMCGIAAGNKGAAGDVLVAESTFDSGAGKLRGFDQFEPAPHQEHGDPAMVALSKEWADNPSQEASLLEGWTGSRPSPLPRIQVGPIASGAAVVETRSVIEGLLGHNRKLIGLDMEAHAVYAAAAAARKPSPACLVAKGLCDYADKNKSDEWQALAAHTSARFLHMMITNIH